MEPSCETIRALDHVVQQAEAQPEPGSSIKHPCLEDCLSSTMEEDTISLGNPEDDDPFVDMYNDINGMVLDRYTSASTMEYEQRMPSSGQSLHLPLCNLRLTLCLMCTICLHSI